MIKITQDVIDDISGGFNIPSPPATLTKVQKICQAEEPDINELSKVIAGDIGLSSAILKVINSPTYGMNRAISDIQQAVMLLGYSSVSMLIAGILIKKSFTGQSCLNLERLWDNATYVAEAMTYIGQNIKEKVPLENLYSTGLFHDCGIVAMSMKYPDYKKLLIKANSDDTQTQTQLEDQQYNTSHATIGYYITNSWGLPRNICQIILQHHEEDFFRQSKDHMNDLIFATLKVANNIADRNQRLADGPRWAVIKDECFDMLGISQLDYEDLQEDIDEKLSA